MSSPADPREATRVRSSRLSYIDVFRGLVMAHMALDHTAWAFFARYVTLELASQLPRLPGGAPAFFVRFTGVPVAPGFSFVAGLMVAVTSERREASGIPPVAVTRRLLIRAAVLTAVGLPLSLTGGGILFDVLFGIGMSLALVALLRRKRTGLLAFVAALAFLLPPWLPAAASANGLGLLLFGRQPISAAGIAAFNPYPLFPWVGFMLTGLIVGRLTAADPRGVKLWLGAAALAAVAFFLIRLNGGVGNAYPHRGLGSVTFWLFAKYPPDMAFTLWAFAGIFALLALLRFLEQHDRLGPLIHFAVFGRVALFFYVMHYFVIAVADHAGLGPIPIVYGFLVWLGLLVLLIWPCRVYWRAKLRWPKSILRYL